MAQQEGVSASPPTDDYESFIRNILQEDYGREVSFNAGSVS